MAAARRTADRSRRASVESARPGSTSAAPRHRRQRGCRACPGQRVEPSTSLAEQEQPATPLSEDEEEFDDEDEDLEELEPDLKGLVEYVARALVDKADAVKVDEVQDGNTTVYELEVDEEDIGKVIGRQGRVVRGLRALVKAAATRKGTRVDLDVV